MVSAVVGQLRELGPVFRSGAAVAAGVSWRDLYALRDAGDLVELSRGVFQLAEVGIDRACPPAKVHVCEADRFDLGRSGVVGEAGERFWISARERTVVDALRLRHRRPRYYDFTPAAD